MKCFPLFFLLCLTSFLPAADAIDALVADSWLQVPTTGQYPGAGVDIHPVCDTGDNMYMIGGCTSYHVASGTHNSDVYRFNIKTGAVVQVYSTATNPFKFFTCQMGQAYDKKRNCVWFLFGQSWDATRGLYRFQCPNGPITKETDTILNGRGTSYLYYDAVDDMLIGTSLDGIGTRNLTTGEKAKIYYPLSIIQNGYEVPSCFDTKRRQFVMTQWGSCWCGSEQNPTDPGEILHDVWSYKLATKSWEVRTAPAVTPGGNFGSEMTYDSKNDKYVYFGSGRMGVDLPELWIYDYDSNVWSQVDRNGRTSNRSNPEASTWPANRFKHGWSYNAKLDVLVNWGGYNYWANAGVTTSDSNNVDYFTGAHQSLWYYRIGDLQNGFEGSAKGSGKLSLSAAPNPFNATNSLSFYLPESRRISLEVFDMNGRLVKTLYKGSFGAGAHRALWDATDNLNRRVTGGLYIYRLTAGKQILSTQAMLSR